MNLQSLTIKSPITTEDTQYKFMENLPTDFVTNIQATYGKTGDIWLKQLPIHLETLSKLWDFNFIKPLSNLSYNFVGLVELNSNHELAILKTAPSGGSIASEVRCLKCFNKGVPHIFKMDEQLNAFLMERLEPGTSLKSLVIKEQDELATRIICQTILDLHTTQTMDSSFKHLSELVESLSYLKGHVKNYTLSKAESLFHDLSADRTKDVLLHGDLHHDNILQSGPSWKTIDPHGYIGDPAAEVGAMLRNPFDCFPTAQPLKKVIARRIKILTEMLPFDAQRMKAWGFCLTILSAAWDVEDFGHVTDNKIEIAQEIDKAIP